MIFRRYNATSGQGGEVLIALLADGMIGLPQNRTVLCGKAKDRLFLHKGAERESEKERFRRRPFLSSNEE